MKKLIITTTAFGLLTGCAVFGSFGGSAETSSGGSAGSSDGSSGRSSGGFFKKREADKVALEQKIATPDERVLISVVSEVSIDKFNGGALVHARGMTDVTGYSNVNLVALNRGFPDENGVVSYEFKAEVPLKKFKGPTPRSNEVYAGISIPANRLPLVKRIRVIAAQNQIVISK